MSKMKRVEARSPEATVTQSFRLETKRFQNEAFRKSHRIKYSYEQDERKISTKDHEYGLNEASHPA